MDKNTSSIVFVNFSENWGGGEAWHLNNALALINKGFNTFLLLRVNSVLHKKAIENNVPCKAISINKVSVIDVFLKSNIKKFLTQCTTHAVILNGSKELKIVAKSAKDAGVKKIIYRRGIPKPITLSIINKWLFRSVVTNIVVNSNTTASAIKSMSEYCKIPTTVVYNGIAVNGRPSKKLTPTAIIVSRLSKEKGVDIAINCWKEVVNQLPDAQLVILGEGTEKETLKHQITHLKLEKNIVLKGFIENPSDIMAESRLLIMPSRWEGFGFVLLEAMSCHLPCIAFKNTSAEEIIEHDKSGYLIDIDDKNRLENAIIKVLKDDRLANSFGNRGFQILTEKFNQDFAVNNLLTVLDLKKTA